MKDMTKFELAAVAGLRQGDLGALVEYLAEADGDTIHPIVIKALLTAIVGECEQTDYRLAFKRHPDLKHHTLSKKFKSDAFNKEIKTAMAVRLHGGHLPSAHDSAISEAIKDTKHSHGTVQEHWKRRRRFIAFCIAHGVLSDPFKG